MYSLDEMPTLRDQVDPGANTPGQDTTISTTLPANADSCYEAFVDVERVPEWVPLVRSVQTLAFNGTGQPTRVAFVVSAGRASLGFNIDYQYDPSKRSVSWQNHDSTVVVSGSAVFDPLSATACMMHYRLDIDLPASYHHFVDANGYGGHAPSAALNDFRDFIGRAFLI